MRLRQRVDLRYTRLSDDLRLVEFAELDKGIIFNGALPPEGSYAIYYRVEITEGGSSSEIVDYTGSGLHPDVLRHLDWAECK